MSAGSAVSKEWSPKIAATGAVVIDNSSCWRYDADVPLIVPEVNADAVAGFRKKGIIANPNCSTAQLVVALKPLHDHARIKRVVVATYQSVSGAGKEAMDELFAQTKAVFTMDEPESKKFPKRIAFNVIPHIDVFMEDGFTREEWKMVVETKKILDPKIKLVATCVRVPVFIGHSEAVNIEFEKPISAEEARELLRNAPGCLVIDKREAGGYATPLRGGGRGRHLHQPHPRGRDGGERPAAVVRVRQPAQGRRAQRHPDRRVPDQPQAHPGQAEGGVATGSRQRRALSPLAWSYPSSSRNRPVHAQIAISRPSSSSSGVDGNRSARRLQDALRRPCGGAGVYEIVGTALLAGAEAGCQERLAIAVLQQQPTPLRESALASARCGFFRREAFLGDRMAGPIVHGPEAHLRMTLEHRAREALRASASASRIFARILKVCRLSFFGGTELACSISHASRNDAASQRGPAGRRKDARLPRTPEQLAALPVGGATAATREMRDSPIGISTATTFGCFGGREDLGERLHNSRPVICAHPIDRNTASHPAGQPSDARHPHSASFSTGQSVWHASAAQRLAWTWIDGRPGHDHPTAPQRALHAGIECPRHREGAQPCRSTR